MFARTIRLTVAATTLVASPAHTSPFTFDSATQTWIVPPGNYTALADFYGSPSFQAANQGTFNVFTSAGPEAVIVSTVTGQASSPPVNFTFQDTAPVTLTASQAGPGTQTYQAIYLQTRSVAGSSGHPGEGGGSSGTIAATITGTTIDLIYNPTTGAAGLYGLNVETTGATGGDSDDKGSNGGTGGQAGAVTVTMTGSTASVTSSGTAPGAALYTTQVGGTGGLGEKDAYGGVGGTAQALSVTVTDSTLNANGTNLTGLTTVQRGGSGGAAHSDGNGGSGGVTEGTTVTLTRATINATGTGATGVIVGQYGGAGGVADTSSTAGVGGATGAFVARVVDSTVTASGSGARGLVFTQAGGAGGTGNQADDKDHSDGNTGGDSAGMAVAFQQTGGGNVVTTDGPGGVAVLAKSAGGTGGVGTSTGGGLQVGVGGGKGGDGGNAGSTSGQVLLTSTGALRIGTAGDNAPGIAAIGQGGLGGTGGDVADLAFGSPGPGGSGGRGGPVQVQLGAGATIQTAGASSPAVVAQSLGGQGGLSGAVNSNLGGGGGGQDAGPGGNSGVVTVTLGQGVGLRTTGAQSPGLFVQSVSGAGGQAGRDAGGFFYGSGGNGGNGGAAGGASVSSAATIQTGGDGARGILVQTISGPGGAGGSASGGIIGSTGGNGGQSGSVGAMTVTNSGSITTSGAGAQGVLVQSLAGGGGVGGNSDGLIYASSGAGSGNFAGSNGGAITLGNSGTIRTTGTGATALMAQSIGGGGGDGGPSSGVLYAHGGDGTAGGTGGAITVNLGGTLSTGGTLSAGLNAQSVGGTGGNGGNVQAASAGATVVIGGSAGTGGAGGNVTVNPSGTLSITTTGTGASGVIAQSVGGGGGTGGAAYAISVNDTFSFAAAVGGAGGDGGAGGTVSINANGATIVTGHGAASAAPPVDSIGVVAQSIGGGGGVGGGASANAVAVGLVPPAASSEIKTVTITATYAAGGTGGSGGNGGPVTVNLGYGAGGGAAITTAGAGSIGALVQSIGGGGGQGGDSSTFAATIGSAGKFSNLTGGTQSYSLSVAVGATGGSGGAGGAAVLTAGLTSNNAADRVQVSTTGDYASGLVVQSIGGGGGNAGLGSSNVTSSGKVSTIRLTVATGASGGTGGTGGPVTVNIYSSAAVGTGGSGAIGVLAQSIGGGGGTSTGTTINLGGLTEKELTPNATVSASGSISVGATGGSGNNGGSVSLYNMGRVTTVANDAPAVVAQSIGGGGGIGGSAGSDASQSGDSSEGAQASGPQQVRSAAQPDPSGNPVTPTLTLETNFSLNVGGKGGAAGNGGTITLTQGGAVATSGDFSPGIVAQSVGGGGGRGGIAVAGGQSNSLKSILASGYVNSAVSLGASGGGGAGGGGGNVTVALDGGGSIATGVRGTGSAGTGLQSFGVLAQSVGGGGGTGADGTTNPNGAYFLGAGLSGGGGAAGNGGTITLNQGEHSSAFTIQTGGDAAHGVVLQSVGGGGGVAGAGAALTGGTAFYTPSVSLGLGGANGSSGSGGMVTANNPNLAVTTTGAGAFGLLAQSVGGGGGLAAVSGAPVTLTAFGAPGGSGGSGGTVAVTLPATATIATSGVGAHGIVVQSVGGGGGIATSYTAGTTPVTSTDLSALPAAGGYGNGGTVTLSALGHVATAGAGAFGVIAQSVGGGGGLATSGGTFYAGGTGRAAGNSGGAVTVTLQGAVSATGANAVGVFAQSVSGGTFAAGTVTVNLGADAPVSVTGGSGGGAGVWVSGGSTSNAITVGPGSTVGAASNQAITYTGPYGVNVTNNGTITGSAALGTGTLTNNGTIMAGGTAQAVAGVAAPTALYGQSTIDGNFVQTSAGRIATNVDFAGGRAGSLLVTGNAALDGKVAPTLATVVANVRVPVLVVTGTATGRPTAAGSALFDFFLEPTATAAGTRFDLVATGSHFAAPGFGLTAGRAAVASGLQSVFAAGAPQYGAFFADLDAIASQQPGEYARRLGQLGPRTALTLGARRAADAAGIANASMSCPVFSAAFTGAEAFLTEGACVYFRAGARTTSDGGDADRGHAELNGATWQIGGQQEIGPGFFLGGSLAYEQSWLNADDGVKGNGSAGQGAVTLKYQTGPILLTAAVFGSVGGMDVQRVIDVAGIGGVAKGSPTFQSAGLRARVAYTVGTEVLYLRPYLNIDGIYAHSGAYQEYGAGAYGLAYADASQTTAIVTPAIEIGGRMVLGEATVLRSFLSAGASIRSNDQWHASARLLGAPAGSGWFSTVVPQDQVAARISAGVQLFQGRHLDLRAQYDGEYGGRATTHGGTLTIAWRL